MILRNGSTLGITFEGALEAEAGFYPTLCLPFVRDCRTNSLVIFHLFEVLEGHGAPTATFPVMAVDFMIFLLVPLVSPVVHVLAQPWVLVHPST